MRRSCFLSLLFCTAMAGCFDPDLGPQPFACAKTGKPCPDDYVCSGQFCVPEGSVDGGTVQPVDDASRRPTKDGSMEIEPGLVQSSENCPDKTVEPNNSPDSAYPLSKSGRTIDWRICYPGDIDYYALELQQGQSLALTVIFTHDQGDLEAALLDPDGFIIRDGRSETDNEVLELESVPSSGTHHLAVIGFGDAVNTYDLDVRLE